MGRKEEFPWSYPTYVRDALREVKRRYGGRPPCEVMSWEEWTALLDRYRPPDAPGPVNEAPTPEWWATYPIYRVGRLVSPVWARERERVREWARIAARRYGRALYGDLSRVWEVRADGVEAELHGRAAEEAILHALLDERSLILGETRLRRFKERVGVRE